MTRRPLTFADLPMFAKDEDIGEAVLGFERRKEFHGFATLRERHGMPKVDAFWGGRCVPAVKAFLLREYGLATVTPLAPDGVEGKYETEKYDRTTAKRGFEVAIARGRG